MTEEERTRLIWWERGKETREDKVLIKRRRRCDLPGFDGLDFLLDQGCVLVV